VNAFDGTTLSEGICYWATSNVNITNATRTSINLFDQNTIIYSDNTIQNGSGIRCIKK
jgi:hypothetical protein